MGDICSKVHKHFSVEFSELPLDDLEDTPPADENWDRGASVTAHRSTQTVWISLWLLQFLAIKDACAGKGDHGRHKKESNPLVKGEKEMLPTSSQI